MAINRVQKKFVAFCIFVAVIVFGGGIWIARSLNGPLSVDPKAKSKNIDLAERGTTLQDRLGVDDHSAVAFLYGADMEGSLDLCG